jgi:hypothetical protein
MIRRYHVTIEISADDTTGQGEEVARGLAEIAGFKVASSERLVNRRTTSQNNAIHKWFSLIANEARNNGETAGMLLKRPAELPITETMLKDCYKQIAMRMYEKDSTTKLSTIEMQAVNSVFERVIAERLNISIPFPSNQE